MMQFVVKGKINGKGRPRFSRGKKFVHVYTDKKTVNYETLIKDEFLIHSFIPFQKDVPLKMKIDAFFEIPKSYTKKKIEAKAKDELLPTKKPDIDNIAKIVLDALNNLAYNDDTQVIELNVSKRYGLEEEIYIQIEELI